MSERVLVNFFYAHPVGHAIEALHYALGHHAADPTREIAVALSAQTPVELASWFPFVQAAYAVDHPFLEAGTAPFPSSIPRDWDWVLDDGRRYQQFQTEMFPGMRNYYAASDQHLTAQVGRSFAGSPRAGYVPHTRLQLDLPVSSRDAAVRRLRDGERRRRIAIMPAGSSAPELYPSAAAWTTILDALAEAYPGVQPILVGRLTRDERTSSGIEPDAVRQLLAHRTRPVDCFDVPLAEQLAVVEASGAFLSPHTGFGMAALAVGTPWLTIGGGRWFEYFFNQVPFRSIVPDVDRFPAYTLFDSAPVTLDDDGSPRTPSMTHARIRHDLERIVTAAGELLDERLEYEQALRDYFHDLVAAHGGDGSGLWSIDNVHAQYT